MFYQYYFYVYFLSNQNKLEANDLYNNLYLAYIKTDEPLLNKIASNGLNELSNLSQRENFFKPARSKGN